MRRSLLLGGVWVAAAAGAVGLGFAAVSLVDASASAPVAPPSASATGEVTGAAAGTQDLVTAGGTVYASCRDGRPVLAGAPAAGWAIDDSSGADEVEFRDGSQKIEVRVDCSTGEPRFTQEGPRADGGGSDDGTVPTSAAPSAPSSSVPSTSGSDDGGGGGGHGSDDAPGDDHGSGGHGSDD